MQWEQPLEGTGLGIPSRKLILDLFCVSERGDLRISATISEICAYTCKYKYLADARDNYVLQLFE